MTDRELLIELKSRKALYIMLVEEIGELAVNEPDEDSGGRTWEELGEEAMDTMLSYPLDTGTPV